MTQRYLAGFDRAEGVLYVGRAQEKAAVWRTQRSHNADGSSYAWLVKASTLVNYFYFFYCVDADFGPFFIKFCMYFPYTGKLCINGQYAETAAMPRCPPKRLCRRSLSLRDAA